MLVSGMITLAHSLGMRVVAEGVETAEQLARLREMGCDVAQGNYFSKPGSSRAMTSFLAKVFPCNRIDERTEGSLGSRDFLVLSSYIACRCPSLSSLPLGCQP